mgnify:CR=1 FL=1
MRRRSRRQLTPTPAERRPVFDPDEWAILRRAIVAAVDGDPRQFKRELDSLSTVAVYGDRSVMYVGFGLRYRSIKRLLRVPTQTDRQELGSAAGDRFQMWVPPESMTLTTLLESVWKFREPVEWSRSNGLIVSGCAGIAVLLDDPEPDLDELESAMREWLEESEEDFAAMLEGLETDRWTRTRIRTKA